MIKKLHLIAFDIPDPPNYGGVIVVYYHLKALSEAGVKVILHAFQYGDRTSTTILEQFCDQTYYYPRAKKIIDQFSQTPFIVLSRSHPLLLERLQADNAPIFFEGHHTCFFLGHPSLKNRQKIVRVHNIEWQYYQNLAGLESNYLKKLYFQLESNKLRQFDTYLCQHADQIIALSLDDYHYYEPITKACHYIPPFHPNTTINSKKGKGDYVLFHGKLSVKDNEKSALFLIEKIAPRLDCKVIVAGLAPRLVLLKAASKLNNVELLADLSEETMSKLVKDAHVHFLWTYQKAGMKLKLLKALFNGRHCLANRMMVENTGLEDLCWLADNTEEIIEIIIRLMDIEVFDTINIEKRKKSLTKLFSNQVNIQKTIDLIWKSP